MAVEIHPIELFGNWDLGYALDQHVIKSIVVGADASGGIVFDNTYSEIGKLLTDFKYHSQYENLPEIVSTIESFLSLRPEMCDFETIIPVPSSRPRRYQPTIEIGKTLAKSLKKYFVEDVLEKNSTIQSKQLSMREKYKLNGVFAQKRHAIRTQNILLIDDLFKTGSTLKECVKVLKEDPLIDKIYVLTVTKTKNQN